MFKPLPSRPQASIAIALEKMMSFHFANPKIPPPPPNPRQCAFCEKGRSSFYLKRAGQSLYPCDAMRMWTRVARLRLTSRPGVWVVPRCLPAGSPTPPTPNPGVWPLLKSRGCVLAGGCVPAPRGKTPFWKARASRLAMCACKSAEQGPGSTARGHTLTQGYLWGAAPWGGTRDRLLFPLPETELCGYVKPYERTHRVLHISSVLLYIF